MNAQVQLDQEFLEKFCNKWEVKELSLFGSALRADFGPESDLDFLVSFDPEAKLDILDMIDMKSEMEAHYGRSVDLVEKEAIRNPWRKHEIMATREIIYEA